MISLHRTSAATVISSASALSQDEVSPTEPCPYNAWRTRRIRRPDLSIHFTRAAKTEQPVLTGCGPYDPDAFTDDGWGDGITWGVGQRRTAGTKVHIARFDIDTKW